jgi:hypothetical protein
MRGLLFLDLSWAGSSTQAIKLSVGTLPRLHPEQTLEIPMDNFRDSLVGLREFLVGDGTDPTAPEVYVRVSDLCRAFLANPQGKLDSADGVLRTALLGFAWHCAQEAVRKCSMGLVTEGLVALIIEGGGEDLRDNIVRLAVLFHSAQLLGMEAASVFQELASKSSNPLLAKEISEFPLRPPKTRNLDAFLIRTSGNGTDFHYELNAASLKRKSWRPWG